MLYSCVPSWSLYLTGNKAKNYYGSDDNTKKAHTHARTHTLNKYT